MGENDKSLSSIFVGVNLYFFFYRFLDASTLNWWPPASYVRRKKSFFQLVLPVSFATGLQAGENTTWKAGESSNAAWKQFFIPAFHGHGWLFKDESHVYSIDGSTGHLGKLIVYGCSLQGSAPGDF